MVALMYIKLQSSGFEYEIVKIGNRYSKARKITVRNIATQEVLFTLNQDAKASTPAAVSKTFYGLNDRYYHIKLAGRVRGDKDMIGQVTPSGAILGNDRTILGNISFYPIYTEGLKEPETIKPPALPPLSTEPTFIGFRDAQDYYMPKKDVSWLKKIMNWIINLLNK